MVCDRPLPEFDNEQAHTEGWSINQRSDAPACAIETLDDPEDFGQTWSFDSDQDAYQHVLRQAALGSAYHLQALHHLGTWAPEALDWVLSYRTWIRIRVPAGRRPHVPDHA